MANKVTRRSLIKGMGTTALGAAAVASGASLGVQAASDKKGSQVPGFYRFNLGNFEVTVLSDGSYQLPTDLLGLNVPREQVRQFLVDHYLDADLRTSHVNIPIINTGDEVVLVDVGGGGNFLSGSGRLIENLNASGYAAEDVDKIVITHCHPDHIWGLIDDFDELAFPNARYFISANEWRFWTTDAAKSTLPESFQSFAAGASRRLPMIKERVEVADGEHEVAPGIALLPTPGHTPGHTSVQVQSGSEKLVVTADTMTHPYISFEHPDWHPRTDLDPDKAEKSRRMILDRAVDDRALLLCYHLSFPGLGNVSRVGNSYRWLPATWRWQL